MFKRKIHLTRILQFMYENPRAFYTIEGFQKFLPDFDQSTIIHYIESLEKDGLAEGRRVWKAARGTELSANPQEQVKGYKLTPLGLAFVKNRNKKSLVIKVAVAGITITTLAITAVVWNEYFQSLVAEKKELRPNQAIPVLVGDTLAKPKSTAP